MATVSITGTPAVLGQLPAAGSFLLGLAANTATDNGDGTWTVAGFTAEENIPALAGLGCTVQVLVTDAEQRARWQAIASHIDRGPGVA